MTWEGLNEYRNLMDQYESRSRGITALKSAILPGAQILTGMPHAPGARDRLGDLAAEIVDMERGLEALRAECDRAYYQTRDYIRGIPDGFLRSAFYLRFITRLPWADVTAILYGDAEDLDADRAEYLRKWCHRYVVSGGAR